MLRKIYRFGMRRNVKTKGKTALSTLETIGGMVLIGIVIIVSVIFFGRGTANAGQFFDQFQMKNKNQLCMVSGNQLGGIGQFKEAIEENKGDGFPDDCDICLGGDNRVVSNSYGIPDDCFVNPAQNKQIRTYKDMCKSKGGCYISDTDQCCIGDAKHKCGLGCK